MSSKSTMRVIGVLILVSLVSCAKKDTTNTNDQNTQLPTVQGLQIVSGALVPSIYGTGIVQGNNEVVVVSKSQGTILKVLFDIGDRVSAGQTLVKITSPAVKAVLDKSRVELANAKKVFDVNQKLETTGSISKVEVDTSQAQYYGALAQYNARLEQYKNLIITAPVTGYIAEKNRAISAGGVIDAGMVVGRISERNFVKIEMSIADTYVSFISKGDVAHVRIPSLTKSNIYYTGTIERIAAAADIATGAITVIVSLPTQSNEQLQQQLRTGVIASVEIPVKNTTEYPLLPKEVIHKEITSTGEQYFIYIVNPSSSVLDASITSVVSKQYVKIGREFIGRVEVIDGLEKDNDKPLPVVIISGEESFFEGDTLLVTIVGNTKIF